MSLRIWICGLALVLVAVAGVALAEGGIPGLDGIIDACRKIEGGRLRAVPSVERCRSYERPLKWNVLAPGAYLLFGGSGYAGVHPADRTFATSLASAGGGVGLRDPSGTLVDSVAWGTATNAFVEGSVAPAPTIARAPGKSAGRHPSGQDTDDNANDFTEGDPTPGRGN
jgi:hypothetical protein